MKNKSKKKTITITSGWFIMAASELSVAEIKSLIPHEFDVEIWLEAGVLEVIIGEKCSMDIEAIECDLRDDFSNTFLREHHITHLFYVSFPQSGHEAAMQILSAISNGIDGFVCADSEDFMPVL